jgi:hypothetical protein
VFVAKVLESYAFRIAIQHIQKAFAVAVLLLLFSAWTFAMTHDDHQLARIPFMFHVWGS